MEADFYDRNGRPVAYSNDGKHIFSFSGMPLAYIDQNSVYSYQGQHLGWFDDGWIRDNQGGCVLYTAFASGGPTRPMMQIKPVKGVRDIMPVRGVQSIRPIKPIKSISWSSVGAIQFFG